MLATAPVGREAQTKKYDILTALGAHACNAEAGVQRLVLRLVTLMTARYNWRSAELIVPRRDIARLWGVNERTVKREFGKLKDLGWIQVKQPGVRGRVTIYTLNLSEVLKTTQASWDVVGPDFVARMQNMTAPNAEGAASAEVPSNVVHFPTRNDLEHQSEDADVWSRARAILRADDETLYRAWFVHLGLRLQDEDLLELTAPTRFHARYIETHLMPRIRAAVARINPQISSLKIVTP